MSITAVHSILLSLMVCASHADAESYEIADPNKELEPYYDIKSKYFRGIKRISGTIDGYDIVCKSDKITFYPDYTPSWIHEHNLKNVTFEFRARMASVNSLGENDTLWGHAIWLEDGKLIKMFNPHGRYRYPLHEWSGALSDGLYGSSVDFEDHRGEGGVLKYVASQNAGKYYIKNRGFPEDIMFVFTKCHKITRSDLPIYELVR